MSSHVEDLMFRRRKRTEQLQDQSASLAGTAATVADQLRERVVPAVGQAAENAREWGQPRVEAARDWARPRVEHGIEVAAPRLESALNGLAPKVDTARDKIVDELLPRVTEAITAWAAASTAARDEAVSRGHGAAAVISGDAVASPKRKRKGRVLLALGLMSAAAAAVVAFMKNSAPKDDPWATPLADPYVAPLNGRHSTVGPADAATAATHEESELIDSLDDTDVPDPLEPTADADLDEKNGTEDGPRA
jgi:AcrR family transcriptional regulator